VLKLYPKGRRSWRRMIIMWSGVLLILVIGGCYMISMPGKSYTGPLEQLTDQEGRVRWGLEQHLKVLAGDIGERNLLEYESLEKTAAYISSQFESLSFQVSCQEFEVLRRTVRNIEVELTVEYRPEELVIDGAHYDSVPGCPGANDNGSGVAALLEIARLLKQKQGARTLRLVAFVNEEPPYFQSEDMGSFVYARRCKQRDENIVAMISLETIGYYSDQEGSQSYPPPFNLVYPSKGDFISFVGNVSSRGLVRDCVASFRRHTKFPSQGGALPSWISGIGWSDHWSFWEMGFPALMVTDTAPFRYSYYHTPSDTLDRVDYDRTARVTAGIARVVSELAEMGEQK